MAGMKSKAKKKAASADELEQEKGEQVSVKELVRDERTHKITATVLLLLSVTLFISYASYLFTWQEDQDKVLKYAQRYLIEDDLQSENLLGRIGAWISHVSFYNGVGIASFLFCSVFFVLGVNLLFAKKIFSFPRTMRYTLMGILILPVAFAFFLQGYSFPWGGAYGNYASGWLAGIIGRAGTAALLFLAGFSYIIWRFNPVFKLPQRTAPVQPHDFPQEEISQPIHFDAGDTEEQEEAEEDVQPGNNLKKESGIVVIPPDEEKANPLNDFSLSEKEPADLHSTKHTSVLMPQEAVVTQLAPVEQAEVPVSSSASKQSNNEDDIELEIKDVEEATEEAPKKAIENLPPYDPFLDLRDYKFPSLNLLENHGSEKIIQDPAELELNKNQIINTLKNYDISIQKITATVGPTVTLYEIVPAAGVRISRIKNLEDDIALSLAALGIRIIAPIPGKGTIGIEVPNLKKTVVSMKTLLSSEKFQHNHFALPIAIGKKIDNENFIVDLASMPHLLMAGATGQGKSVGVNALLVSLLYKKHPSQLKFVLVDPKKVELSLYRTIEQHFLAKLPGEEEAIITDTKKVIHTLNALCIEMDNRYDLLKEAQCRNIREYNEKFVARKLNPQNGHQYLPFIVLVIDEFADLIMTAGKEVEMPIARLAQLARAVGIHLIIATQRPSVNIITGTIKANFPARIAFKVSSKVDSRTILDAGGAEQLIGKGDMLISYNGEITRLQCAYVDTPEVEEVCRFISKQRGYPHAFLLPEYIDEKDQEGRDFDMNDRDSLFEDAARLIVQNQVGSTSLLQRRMKLGYNRAGRLMDQLEAAGIVGPNQGSKARDVLFKTEADLNAFLEASR